MEMIVIAMIGFFNLACAPFEFIAHCGNVLLLNLMLHNSEHHE
jgi:hypothetical protein